MMPHLLSSFDHAHPCPSLGMILRITTAIHRCLPDDLPSFDPPEIAWRCSPEGMALIQPSRFGESEHVLLVLDQHWQPLRDPRHAMAAILAEAELEYEAIRPIGSQALVVKPQDASPGLSPSEGCRIGNSLVRRYGAGHIDQIRNALSLTACGSARPCKGAIGLLAEKPLTPETETRAREIVTAWDRHQADDVIALARSGLATWRRIAARAGYDSIVPGTDEDALINFAEPSRPIRKQFPWSGLPEAHNGKAADAHLV